MPGSRANVRVVYECAYHSSADDNALVRPDLLGALSWSAWELEGVLWSSCYDEGRNGLICSRWST